MRDICVDEALSVLAAAACALKTESVSVFGAQGLVLGESVAAPIDLPPFDNSAVDGFAISLQHDWSAPRQLSGCIRAGDVPFEHLDGLKAVRVMTGAQIPVGTDAIAMQEHVSNDPEGIQLCKAVALGGNIRKRGEDLPKGALALSKGTVLGAKEIGLLCTLGLDRVCVAQRPKLHLVTTGNELVAPGRPLAGGQVFHSTGPMLSALAQDLGADVVQAVWAPDNPDAIFEALCAGKDADVVVVVGGMADGDRDFGREALQRYEAQELFFRGRWRPGKPTWVGRRGSQLVLGLPGNPVAAFVMCQVFLRHLLDTMLARHICNWRVGCLNEPFQKRTPDVQFARAVLGQSGEIDILPGQGSHQVFELHRANCLVWLDEGARELKAGEPVRYQLL